MINNGENNHLKVNPKKVLKYINMSQQLSSNNINYRFFTDSVMELSGASLVVLNLVSEKDKRLTTVKAVSGTLEILSQISNVVGYNLEGSDWEGNYDAIKIVEKNKLISFSSFKEIGYYDSVPQMAPLLHMLEKLYIPGGLYTMDFEYQGVFLGMLTLVTPIPMTLENSDLVELYMSQISGTIKRLRAESKLQQKIADLQLSEQKFKTYLEKSPLGIFVVDSQGRYIGVNRSACHMSGYTDDELLKLAIPDLLAPEFLDEGMKLFEGIVNEGSGEVEVMLRKKDGEYFWVNLSSVKIDDNQVIAFCQDITERKAEKERSKELNCLHSFSQMLEKEDNDLETIFMETIKLLPPSFEYPEDVGVSIIFYEREFKTQNYKSTPWNISTYIKSHGEPIGIIDVCSLNPPLHNRESFSKEEKLMLRTISEHINRVSAQFQAKEELQKSRNQLATTLDSIGDGVIVTDNDGRITRMNPRAEKLTGWKVEDALGKDLHEVFHIENVENGKPVPNPVYRVINTGKIQELENDTILIARDGTKCHIADSAAPIRDDEDNILGVIMVFSDVTARKNVEDSLKYQFSFEKMLANVSNTFASEPSDQLEQNIQYALKQIGEFFQVDRSYVFQFSEDGLHMSNTHEWCADGIESHIDELQNMPINTFPWWAAQICENKHVYITDVDNLPPDAEVEKKEFMSQDIRSLLSIPMLKNGTVFGFLGLDAVKDRKILTENQIMLLTVVVELVAHAYTRNLEEQKVRYQSYHDGLTGLYNRGFLEMEMERLDVERQLPIGIIMADLNELKLFNDAFGHEVGDEMLRQTAIVLKKCCRKEDIISRWGGDEFLIFLPQTSQEDVDAIFRRIEKNCRESYVNDISLSLSLGSAIKSKVNEDLSKMLKKAEENMYKHKTEESLNTKNNVISVILKNLEAKSFESATHYNVMQVVAHSLGVKIGLSQSELEQLELLIRLHDIGEITISEKILLKNDSLTDEEWGIIKKHPETGFRIARAFDKFAHVAEEILCHHERWDGTGYPRGLRKNEIPILARIAAIADAYEVMSSGRVYKKALTESEVITELKRCAGSQFDPELIEIFLLLL